MSSKCAETAQGNRVDSDKGRALCAPVPSAGTSGGRGRCWLLFRASRPHRWSNIAEPAPRRSARPRERLPRRGQGRVQQSLLQGLFRPALSSHRMRVGPSNCPLRMNRGASHLLGRDLHFRACRQIIGFVKEFAECESPATPGPFDRIDQGCPAGRSGGGPEVDRRSGKPT